LIVAFDASILIFVLDDSAKAPVDPKTGHRVTRCKERVQYLIETLQRDGAKIIVPTPSIAEVLVRAQQAAPEWLRILNSSKHFRIAPFDERAAVEFAASQANRVGQGIKAVVGGRQKAKFDDQIVAIAAVESATVIYSDDEDIKRLAGTRFEVRGIAELPLPVDDPQGFLPLDACT
jgi:predicted nucleic acid-binding protein